MEKLGISNQDLFTELKASYHEARAQLAEQVKLGSAGGQKTDAITAKMSAIKERLDALEAELKGS